MTTPFTEEVELSIRIRQVTTHLGRFRSYVG
jgi:hypothetical protein